MFVVHIVSTYIKLSLRRIGCETPLVMCKEKNCCTVVAAVQEEDCAKAEEDSEYSVESLDVLHLYLFRSKERGNDDANTNKTMPTPTDASIPITISSKLLITVL